MDTTQNHSFRVRCPYPDCKRWFKSQHGLTYHKRQLHSSPELLVPMPESNQSIPKSLDQSGNDIGPDPSDSNVTCDAGGLSSDSENLRDLWADLDNGELPVGNDEPHQQPVAYGLHREYHPYLTGTVCDEHGLELPPGMPPTPWEERASDDYFPYSSRIQFEVADFLFRRNQMSAGDIDMILGLWAASLIPHGDKPPFRNHTELYDTIDTTTFGDAPWQSVTLNYNGEHPDGPVPSWMESGYDIWYRDPRTLIHDLISNPDFKDEFHYTPFHEYVNGKHCFQDFMSGDWAWKQADEISKDPTTHGAMFVPIILGSDKTTVSVATGHNEYWPIYLSIGNIRNTTRRAHRNGVVLLGFHAIPKSGKEFIKCSKYRRFRWQLFHTTLSIILSSLRPAMEHPEVVRCSDNHFRRAIYGIGPYIADYPEQCMLTRIVQGWCPKCTAPSSDLNGQPASDADGQPAGNVDGQRYARWCRQHTAFLLDNMELQQQWKKCGLIGDIIPFTEDFPRADIHELIAPDILHQLIKGTFKDHIVTWIQNYIFKTHTEKDANKILDDIDRRIAIVAPFSELRRFPQGRGFKQWTGDDSKALMKVYLPAIEGYVPEKMVRAVRALLEFVYLSRRNIHDTESIEQMKGALKRFQESVEVFVETGVREEKSTPPRQHAMIHYIKAIRLFGAPNGLCTSITESKHIKAIKEPWQRSNRFNALGQMLLTNQRLDKLAAARVNFTERGMLKGTCLSEAKSEALQRLFLIVADSEPVTVRSHTVNPDNENDDGGAVSGPRSEATIALSKTIARRGVAVEALADDLQQPDLELLICMFLAVQIDYRFRTFKEPICVYSSAIATFYAPSDRCGTGGMHTERIRATPSWWKAHGRYDCVFVKKPSTSHTIPNTLRDFDVARVRAFFSSTYQNKPYSFALIHDFTFVGEGPDEDTGMWIVKRAHCPPARVVPLNAIYRAAHLIPVYHGERAVKRTQIAERSLDEYRFFYINKFIDHHAFEIVHEN